MALGATRRRIWRDVSWPNIRPGVAQATAMVFTLALVEPAGPIVFERNRTLAVQIVHATERLGQPTHASALAVLAALLAMTGRMMIGWWGGAAPKRSERPGNIFTQTPGFQSSNWSRLTLLIWVFAASGPIGLWIWRGVQAARWQNSGTGAGSVLSWLADPETRVWAANSAWTAGLAILIDLALLRALSPRRPGGGRGLRWACRAFEAVPPLALAAWALATPWILLALADTIGGPTARWARSLSLELSPGRSPGVLLVLVLAATALPRLAEVARLGRGSIQPSRVAASRLMGESDARASRAGGGVGWLGVVPLAPAFLAFVMAATSLAPSVLLTPFSERRTLSPGLLTRVVDSGPADPGAVGPAVALLGLNLMAFGIALRGQGGSATRFIPSEP